MNKELDDLAVQMFRTFSRFEYALKAVGFHTDNAEPNWTAFACSLPNLFSAVDDPSLRDAVKYMLSHPPKKQVVSNGKLDWSNQSPDSRCHTDLILLYVRRVRNNLFHGGCCSPLTSGHGLPGFAIRDELAG
jgi:hypothetical protein